MADWAIDWRRKYFDGQFDERVAPPLFEEDLPQSVIDEPGALIALHRAYVYLTTLPDPPTHILILAGDNFIDASIARIVEASFAYPDAPLIATRTLASSSHASGRFGVVEIDRQGTIADRVIGYEEKPLDPKSSEVSIGLYLFPTSVLDCLADYLSTLPDSDRHERAGAPGHFVSWLVERGRGVRAVEFNVGNWIDVGTPSSLLASIVQVTRDLVERPTCARDLDVLGTTANLSDKYYFLCHRAVVHRADGLNRIDLYFDGDDSIATLSKQPDAAPGALHVNKVRENSVGRNEAFWQALADPNAHFGDREATDLDAAVLISGGVFLLDRGTSAQYSRNRCAPQKITPQAGQAGTHDGDRRVLASP